MLGKYYPKMLILIKDACMRTEGWKKKLFGNLNRSTV